MVEEPPPRVLATIIPLHLLKLETQVIQAALTPWVGPFI